MAKTSRTPRISVNKLGEYLVSRAGRQNRILRDQKFPQDFVVAYYREAQEAISLFMAGNMEDIGVLERKISSLDQKPASNIYETRKLSSNIEAIESFMNLLDDIDFQGAKPRLGKQNAPKLLIRNVDVSVRPEVILCGTGKSKANLVGGVKLHFPRTFSLTKDAAGYVSAATQMYCEYCLADEGTSYGQFCTVIDVGAGIVWPGVRAVKQRRRDIEDGCAQIAALWPSITQ